jgi:anti-sigma regulatory factor (Ser/Thr protein kinase)
MSEISWRRQFPGDPRQLRVMRRWLASLLPGCPALDDLALAATELASNAIRHTASGQGGQFAVEVTRSRGMVRVAVTDGGAADEPRVIDDPLSEHGRGLRAVGGLSERMGVSGGHLGRRVWADIAWGDADAAEPASPQPAADPIAEGLAYLGACFPGVEAWYGSATATWWAIAGSGGLLEAPTARDLAGLLSQVPGQSRPPAGPGQAVPGTRRQRPGHAASTAA